MDLHICHAFAHRYPRIVASFEPQDNYICASQGLVCISMIAIEHDSNNFSTKLRSSLYSTTLIAVRLKLGCTLY